MSRSTLWLSFAAFALPLLLSRAAAAQVDPRKEAKRLYDDGVDRAEQGDHAGALERFREAYALAPLPIVLFNVGQAHAALGQPVEAVEVMSQVLDSPGSLSPQRVAQARATRDAQAPLIGELEITASEPGAAIELNGVVLGPAPQKLRLKVGAHRIGAVLEGFAPARKDVTVASGPNARLELSLAPTEARLAKLLVRTSVPGAKVKLAGETLATTPMAAAIAVLPGSLELEITRPGYRPLRRPLALEAGKSADLELTLEEDPAEIERLGARLSVEATEDNVVVQIDGQPRGVYGAAIPVAPGPHRVVLERGGFYAQARDVIAPEAETTRLTVRFRPTPETVVAHKSAARARRIGGWVGFGLGLGLAGGMGGLLAWNEGRLGDAADQKQAFDETLQPGGECHELSLGYDGASCRDRAGQINDDLSAAQTRRAVGWVFLGVGVAGAVSGTVVALTGDDPDKYDRPPRDELARWLRPWLAPLDGGAAAGVFGRF